jgi:hypothetical protein
MLTFLSIFVGWVVGVHPVELTVGGDVATIEILLDDASVGKLEGRPWKMNVDFGPALVPHRLVAVGRDAGGTELARIAQWLNFPGDLVKAELTALPLTFSGKPPDAAEMAGWFVRDGEPLEVAKVESGGADILIVQEATPRLWGKLLRLHKDTMEGGSGDPLKQKLTSGLHHGDSLRVLLPVGPTSGSPMQQFFVSDDFADLDYGPATTGVVERRFAEARPYGVLATLPFPFEGAMRDDAPRRVADAVAAAAQIVAAKGRPRAVVLIKDRDTKDVSAHRPESVRRYLERMHVPLLVWSPERSKKDPWGDVLNISSEQELLRAVLQLRRALDDQHLVWLRGRHLPQEIELSAAAAERAERVGAAGTG